MIKELLRIKDAHDLCEIYTDFESTYKFAV